MSLKIVHYNHPVLRKKGAKVTVFDSELTKFTEAMIESMHDAHGIGLAAQQVGRAVQVFVMDLRDTPREFSWELDGSKPPLDLIMPMVLVNPEVTPLPSEKTSYEEGCLSFPEIRGDVIRPDLVNVKFQDISGGSHTLTCNGLFARCIQHEVDHLNGVLFIDRMEKKVRSSIDRPIKDLAKRTKEATPLP